MNAETDLASWQEMHLSRAQFQRTGSIVSHSILGGLHRHYTRILDFRHTQRALWPALFLMLLSLMVKPNEIVLPPATRSMMADVLRGF